MIRLVAAFLCVLAPSGYATARVGQAESKIQTAVKERIPKLRAWARDPTLVSTIQQANSRARSTDDIREIDERWQSTPGIDDFMRSLLNNRCSTRLRTLKAGMPEIAEAFATDRNGANVAMTNKTSDYWQGDEAKFSKTIAGGEYSYHLDPVSFDESIQAYAVQVSLPVFDGGEAIGVLVVTLNLERLETGR